MGGDDVVVDGEVLAHRRLGHGQRVLFVHGWLTGGEIWAGVLDALAPGEGTVIEAVVPDLRGSAASGGTASAELSDHADELWRLLDGLDGDDPVDLVGHSMGGAIVTLMATRRPEQVRRLVLVCPVPPTGFELPQPLFAQFDAAGGDEKALRRFLAPQVPAAHLDAMVRLCARTGRVSASNTLRAWTGAAFGDAASKLTHAPLVLAGSKDVFLSAEVLRQTVAATIPGSRVVEVEGGHYPMFDAPGPLATRISEELVASPV